MTRRHDDRSIASDRCEINLSGSRHETGLEAARELMEALSLTMHEMVNSNLPDRIKAIEPEAVKNPFA